MNFTIKLMLCILCLNLNTQIGKAESFYPPVEKVKPPVEKKSLKKNRKTKNILLSRDKNKKITQGKKNSLQSQQMGSVNFDYICLALLVGGLVTFIVGAALAIPVIWIIGGVFFLIGFIGLLIITFLEPYWTRAIILWLISGLAALIGIALFIIGLITGTLALWVGGLIFILPLIIWALIYLIKS